MDRIKDILYDGTEYILMIAIIAIVAFVINWRLEGLFAMDVGSVDKELETSSESIVDEFSQYEESNEDEIQHEDESNVENVEEDENNNKNEETEVKGESITIVIPSGTLPSGIASILVSNNLIDDKTEFINKVVEMGVETKLKSGTFKISKGSSLEEIISIIIK